MVSVSRMIGGSDPHNETTKNAGNSTTPAAQTPTTKKVSAFKRLGKFAGSKKEPMYPLRDLEDSEKITSTPQKISGMVILKREKKRRMNLQKRYHAKLNNGVLKLYKQKDKQKEDKKPFTAEFDIDLSTLSQVMYNDNARKLSLVFQKETYTLVSFDKDKYMQWKTGIHQHRLYRQFQKKLQKTQLAFQNIVEDGAAGKLENKVAINQEVGPLVNVDEKPTSPKHSKEGDKDEKKGKEMNTNENNNLGTGSPKKTGSSEGDKEEKRLVTALKALGSAMETYKLVHSSSIQILDRIQKCHDESNEILRELKKLRRRKHSNDDDECCSDEDEEDSTSVKERPKEVPATTAPLDQNAIAMLKASVSALNINEEELQVAKVKKGPSLPNIAVSNAKNQSETRIKPLEPHVALPTQSPAPSAIPAQTQAKPRVDAAKPQVHPALLPPKKR
ncbi:unnamed protein product [Bursaphelenchus xylophilus]|uniref:(pine wood nematode) hypothetical protein n=1 Tax=Bursaphelenchus xylophilus TaxID=6326 RepID=A0A7I8WVI1_BURXY|nr:unnamed protein product [Bursaphelenchus xylophilus]CAG9117451.1 unnamed protein product [Bursaphelenchus xylophilus]